VVSSDDDDNDIEVCFNVCQSRILISILFTTDKQTH